MIRGSVARWAVCTYGCRSGFTLEHGDDHKSIFSDVVVLQGRFVFQNLTLVDQNLVRVREQEREGREERTGESHGVQTVEEGGGRYGRAKHAIAS